MIRIVVLLAAYAASPALASCNLVWTGGTSRMGVVDESTQLIMLANHWSNGPIVFDLDTTVMIGDVGVTRRSDGTGESLPIKPSTYTPTGTGVNWLYPIIPSMTTEYHGRTFVRVRDGSRDPYLQKNYADTIYAINYGDLLRVGSSVITGHDYYGIHKSEQNLPADKCSTLSAWGAPLYMSSTWRGKMNVTFDNNQTALERYGLRFTFVVPVRLEIPVKVTASPSSLSFGQLTTGTTGLRDLNVTVGAISGANHTISFAYTSDGSSREVLTVDNYSLPYTASRTIPSGQSSRSEVFKVRITSPTAAAVSGRLQITAKLT